MKKFLSTPHSLWDSVAIEYEDNSFHGRDGLYPANSFRYEIIFDFLKERKGTLLDAGCGPGLFTRNLQKQGWAVVACDYSEKMLAFAKQKAEEESLENVYHHLPLQKLGELNQKFDFVVLNGVLPYIANEEEKEVFNQIKKVLKKDGVLIASHYNFYFDIFSFDKWTVEASLSLLAEIGLAQNDLALAKEKIGSLFKNPEQTLDKEKTMKTEDPINYKNKLQKFGFEEFDQAFYNLFYLPAKFERVQKTKTRELLERKLRRDPRGLLFYRTFISFAKLVS